MFNTFPSSSFRYLFLPSVIFSINRCVVFRNQLIACFFLLLLSCLLSLFFRSHSLSLSLSLLFSLSLSLSFCIDLKRLLMHAYIQMSPYIKWSVLSFFLSFFLPFFLSFPFRPLFNGLVTVETAFFLLLLHLDVTSFEIFSSSLSFSHKYLLLLYFLAFFFSFSISCLLSLFHLDVAAFRIRRQTGPSIPLGDEFSSQPREHALSAHMHRQVSHQDKSCEPF
ncbi:unnamed protein product [Acanthosepion pharaonis]|uniref:Uncharacterized protein n=1 Tax=Acanthosepion pharaonis TaxID=158019 RepID=A0A812CGH9_ACAPH|nr:unnamed protein product [Sepia pharaonis]